MDWRITVCAAVLVLATGCESGGGGKKATEPGAKKPVAAAPARPVVRGMPGFGVARPALDGVTALQMIPKDALFVAAGESVAGLLDRLGRERLQKAFGSEYEMAVAVVTQATGHNLLDPKNLPGVGIDPSKPFGFVWLNARQETGAFFVSLTDAEKLKTTVYALAGKVRVKLTAEKVGDAVIISDPRDTKVCLVLRGEVAFVVFTDRRDEDGLAAARRIATVKKEESIAVDAAFRKQVGELEYGRDVAAYANLPALVSELVASISRAPTLEWAQERLDVARKSGDPTDIANAEQSLEREKAWAEERKASREREAGFTRSLFGPLGGVALGVQIEGPALKMKLSVAVGEDALAWRLFRNGSGVPALTRAQGEQPLFLAAGHVDRQALRELVEAAVVAAGESRDFERFKQDLAELTGLAYAPDIVGLPAGEAGLAVVVDRAIFEDPSKLESVGPAAFGGSAVLAVTDTAKAQQILDHVAALPEAKPIVKRDASGRLEIAVPDFRTVYVGLAGDYLVASTDARMIERVAKQADGGFAGGARNPAFKALLAAADQSQLWMMDWSTLGWLMFASRGDSSAAMVEEGPWTQSPAYQAKKKEVDAIQAQIEGAYTRRRAAEHAAVMKAFSAAGVLAAQARAEAGGLVVHGGQYFAVDNAGALAERIALAVKEMISAEESGRAENDRLQQQRFELERELDGLRAAETQKQLVGPGGAGVKEERR